MTAILKREFKSFFHGMMGWILMAFLLLVCGLYFTAANLMGGTPEFGYYTLYNSCFVFLIFIPVLTMRSLAEEKRSRTDQLLLTSPVSVGGIVMGKFLALLAVFGIPLLVLGTMPLVLSLYGTVNLATCYASLLAYLCMGAAAIAICMWVSGLTENQIISCLCSFGILLLCFLMPSIQSLFTVGSTLSLVVLAVVLAIVSVLVGLRSKSLTLGTCVFAAGAVVLAILFRVRSALLTSAFSAILGGLCLFEPFSGFVQGSFSVTGLLYYLSVAALFLFLTGQTLEKRRWN